MIKYLLKFLFPPKCIFCKKLLPTNTEIEVCTECYDKITFYSGELLYTGDYIKIAWIDKVICLCEYSGIIKDAVIRYKFFNKPGYYRTFAKLLSKKVKKMTNSLFFDIIISVPLHSDREKERGYNQSYLISRLVGKEIGIPEASGILERTRNTPKQSLLGKEQRGLNIKGAFKVNNADKVKGKKILIIDDILTTGSTLSECGRVLTEAGAKSVTAAVIASGKKHLGKVY
ncbi:MAG: ComF family protein [Bacillota bacterium]|nr:ComF family protein [Bacillota bacterium]